MQRHKYNIFPEINGEDYERLRNDLANGYDKRYPIYIYEGKILDGWNRYKICQELNIEPNYEEFIGSEIEALEFVMRTNKRRNLSSSQWAVIALDNEELVSKLKEEAEKREIGGRAIDPEKQIAQGRTSEKLASMFNTNQQYIKDIIRIKQENPEALEDIRSGKKTITEHKREKALERKQKEHTKEKHELREPRVAEYDSNMFYQEQSYSESRFGDNIFSLEDEKYNTMTTISRFFHKDTMREFSLREYAQVQTFPKDFKFVGNYSTIKEQIGNAVAPDMGEFITRQLKGKTCGDLFAGCGGFTCGIHRHGIETKWAVEWELEPALTYKMNFPEAKVYHSNIKVLEPKDFEEVDIIIGGPPCQGFSSASPTNKGKRTFKSDPRNELYKEFLRFVEFLRPKEFIMENVKEIQDVKEEIQKDFESIGYEVETKLVKGNDIGMKQNRIRFFFLGKLRDINND